MDVLNQVRKLGRDASRRAELREYCQLNNEEILRLLPGRVLSSEGTDLLDCLLNGIPDTSPASISYKTKVMDAVLGRLRGEATSLSVSEQLVARLRLELPRAPPAEVARHADDCVQSLMRDDDINMTWRDILPECLSVLSERGRLVHCGTEMSADEFKAQCVQALCQCRWQERCVVQLAAMFTDMQLDREAHAQVVTKLCTVMLELPPDSVPPLLLQLLKLCKSSHLETVLAYLSRYFNMKLYGRLGTLQDSDSTHMDVEEFGGHTESELTECVSTCVYHMVSTAPEQLLKVLKGWPRSRLLRAPLLLEATLALADGSAHRGACVALARAAVQQSCLDERHRLECGWLRDLLADDVDVTRVLKIVIAESTNHRQLTTPGLMELAFALLGVPAAPGRERAALRCWRYAELALVRLARAQPETAPHMLGRLADRLSGARQYADCLLTLCKLTPLALERCTQLCSIIENCQALNGDFHSAAAVLDAVHPILRFSSRVRDTMVMVCRKGLFARDSASRCLALWGFLSLLRHVKLSAGGGGGGGDSTSSDQYSVNSYLTQISIDLHSTQLGASVSHVRNEAVCREVVSILRRCFHQDAAVKQLLYTHIYSCVKRKVSLHESILELLYEHLTKYISEKGDIDFEKCVKLTATGATLTEPIGYLLVAVQQFLQEADEPESEDALEEGSDASAAGYFKRKLAGLMEGLCDVYRGYTLADLRMEGEHGLTDATPESRAKCIGVQQALQVCEALAAHRLLCWSPGGEAPARDLNAFLALHSQLLQHAKTPSKLTKKGNKVTQNDKETQKSQKTPRRGKDKEKAPVKLSALVRDKAIPFKQLPCLWDLMVCCRALELLYSEEVAWSSAEQRAAVRTRRDVHQFALGALQAALAADSQWDRAALAAGCARAATTLYRRCLTRFQDMCDFHEPTAAACVDAFRDCLATVAAPQRRLDTLAFLRQVTGESEGSTADCLAAILRCVLNGLQQLDSELASEAEPAEQDAMSRRLVAALVQLASLAVDKLPPDTSESLDTVVVSLGRLVRSARVDCAALLPPLLSAGARARGDARLADELLLKLRAALGKIDGEEDSAEDECDLFPFMDESVAQGVHGHVCAHVSAQCTHVDRLLQRAKELDAAAKQCTHHDTERIEKELTELDKSAVVQLCQLGGRVSRLAELRCTVGVGSDRILQAAVRLYTPLTTLVMRLQRSPASYIHTIWLERALGVCGRRLSAALDELITYVESSQAAAARDKVLRDTRQVPRLVYAADNFSKHVILLANKTKLNLQRHLSLGTARDFRIKAAVLAEALRVQRPTADDIDEDDVSTVVLTPAAEEMDVDEAPGAGEAAGEAEEGVRAGKRRRLSAR